MSTHDGVSCDSCLKSNFRGRRYKCLICYDYDLCAACYEAGATNTRHTVDHPMQCILTRADFDVYYGGEGFNSTEQPQSYTCPFCYRMGFTEATLHEHVTSEHADASYEVICPICAAMPGGDPNLMTDDFAGHLTLEHRTGPRDLISFLDEPVASRHSVRRIPHSTHLPRGGGAAQSTRARRSNMHFSVFSSGGLSSLSPSSRESVDPIAELLSQLSGVRRSTSNTNTNTPTQLQQLQMQLQMERQQVNQARQQLERLPRRQTQSQTTLRETATTSTSSSSTLLVNPAANSATVNTNTGAQSAAGVGSGAGAQNNFLLSRVDVERPNLCGNENEDYSHAFVNSLVRYTMTLEKMGKCKSGGGQKEAVKNTGDGGGVAAAARDGRILRGRARSNSANVTRQDISKSSSKDTRENTDRNER